MLTSECLLSLFLGIHSCIGIIFLGANVYKKCGNVRKSIQIFLAIRQTDILFCNSQKFTYICPIIVLKLNQHGTATSNSKQDLRD